jgi:1-acyl-sn-glycerol-3-phosphate acyltransferase
LLAPSPAVSLGRLRESLPMFYHRLCCRISLEVERRGTMATVRPTLFVCNHVSYLDIAGFGAVLPGCFVAKAEVARWPFFGLLAKLQRTVFIDRRRRAARDERDSMSRRLAAGDNLILFPEGTSSDGNRTLPFRSALLSVAEDRPGTFAAAGRPLTVQPVSIGYTRLDGAPMGYGLRPFVAWYGDMNLVGHLWRLAGLGRVAVTVEFHRPVTIDEFGSRKALTEHCQRAVAEGVAAAIGGRGRAPGVLPAAPAEAPGGA